MLKSEFWVAGADPDTKNVGIALVRGHLPAGQNALSKIRIEGVWSVSAPSRSTTSRDRLPLLALGIRDLDEILVQRYGEIDLLVVEAMAHRPTDKRPDDIVQLAAVQGMLMTTFKAHEIRIPLPVTWKGTMGKTEHQNKVILPTIGLDRNLRGVPGAEGLTAEQIWNVVDAVGLAVWGIQNLARAEISRRLLND